jgi:hypothetical protein
MVTAARSGGLGVELLAQVCTGGARPTCAHGALPERACVGGARPARAWKNAARAVRVGGARPEQAHMGGGRPVQAWKKAARGVQPARARRRLVRYQQCLPNVSWSREHRYKCRGGGRQPFKVGSRCGEKMSLHFIYINVNFCFNSGRIYEKIFQHIGKLRISWQICI